MKKAFTLIELIFVIVIIGLLAAVALPRFMDVTENAKLKGAVEVANQIVNKATSRYELIQDANITRAIQQDADIQQYLERLVSEVDKHFNWDANESYFVIKYDPAKTTLTNTDGAGNAIVTTNDGIEATGATCIEVNRSAVQVPVTADANVTKYRFFVAEVNYSCITAAQ